MIRDLVETYLWGNVKAFKLFSMNYFHVNEHLVPESQGQLF